MDCLEGMKLIPDKSIDMILCDLPYGTTRCKWDTIIPFEPLWEQYERIIKDNGAIVLTAKQPFTSKLVTSNVDGFRYELIWEKEKGTDFGNANRKPLNAHENILVFYKKQPTYNKQMIERDELGKKRLSNKNNPIRFTGNSIAGSTKSKDYDINRYDENYKNPKNIIKFKVNRGKIHPTQKPVLLMEYLIKTYTNEGDTVLDFTMGSGSIGVACKNLNRKFIGIELDENYFNIAKERIENLKVDDL